jgi:ketosteroid isomerase-like protein
MTSGYSTGPLSAHAKVFDVAPRVGLPSRTSMPRVHHLRAVAIAAIVLAVLPLSAAPHHKKQAREQIVSLEGQFRQAQLNLDIPAMDKLLSDDYLGIGVNGEVSTKAQQLDRMRERDIVLTKLDTSDLKIKLVGQIAIVTSLASVEGTVDTTPLHGMLRYTRIYKRLPNGTWKITNFEATRIPQRRERDVAQHNPPTSN